MFESAPNMLHTINWRGVRRLKKHSDVCKGHIILDIMRMMAGVVICYYYHVMNWARDRVYQLFQELSDVFFASAPHYGRYPEQFVASPAYCAYHSSITATLRLIGQVHCIVCPSFLLYVRPHAYRSLIQVKNVPPLLLGLSEFLSERLLLPKDFISTIQFVRGEEVYCLVFDLALLVVPQQCGGVDTDS